MQDSPNDKTVNEEIEQVIAEIRRIILLDDRVPEALREGFVTQEIASNEHRDE